MLQGLIDGVGEQLKNQHALNGRVEGSPQDGWVLIDYGDVVLHLFSPDRRNYYRLEELWGRDKVILRLQ